MGNRNRYYALAVVPVLGTPKMRIGWKIRIIGQEYLGFGEISALADENRKIHVVFHISPIETKTITVGVRQIDRERIEYQTRCYIQSPNGYVIGRIVSCHEDPPGGYRTYWVQVPNEPKPRIYPENEFQLRSNFGPGNPVATLAFLAHETPFFFENRSRWVVEYARQLESSSGLTGLVSSKIELFPHQAEVVRRVLKDPIVRYLLADEVGLGKTIEAGCIMRQFVIDAPRTRIGIFVPKSIQRQWQEELVGRFGLGEADIVVGSHENLAKSRSHTFDMVVVDEAHRIVPKVGSNDNCRTLFEALQEISKPERTPHLLLLSATPVLHYEAELLALLHLLDPEMYDLQDIDGFKRKLERRGQIGKALLALERVTQVSFLHRQVEMIAALLPHDKVVGSLSKDVFDAISRGDSSDKVLAVAGTLRIHLSETYRIHRRLLRTRRRQLVEQGEIRNLREPRPQVVESKHSESPQSGSLLLEAWKALDEWRLRAASHASDHPEEEHAWVDLYLGLAYSLASNRTAFIEKLGKRLNGGCLKFEEPQLVELMRISEAEIREPTRPTTLEKLLAPALTKKSVVFCGEASTAHQVSDLLSKKFSPLRVAKVYSSMTPEEIASSIRRFRTEPSCSVLIADRTLEEGANLEFADQLVLYDLPFDTMRLEQRVGRLDRINRVKKIPCTVLLSCDDPEIALDAAWYHLLLDGFGILSGSLADLHFVADREGSLLAQKVFYGGPAALLTEIPRLKEVIEQEREASEEQDVLDGLHTGSLADSPFFKALDAGDADEEKFGSALNHYAEKNIGLFVKRNRLDEHQSGRSPTGLAPVVSFHLHREHLPLLPASRLTVLSGNVRNKGTYHRKIATKHAELDLLRPGHPIADSFYQISMWDERGKAFALWRRAPTLESPVPIFRVCCSVLPDVFSLQELEKNQVKAHHIRKSLSRMIEGWFPIRMREVFLNPEGIPAEADLVRVCRVPYNNEVDVNLSGVKAAFLPDFFGKQQWRKICENVARKAIEFALRHPETIHSVRHSVQQAHEYFGTTVARLENREVLGFETHNALKTLIRQQREIESSVSTALNSPVITIDTIGIYILGKNSPITH